MDLSTTIIGLAIGILCFLPFILAGQKTKRKEKEIFHSLKKLAKENKSTLSKHDLKADLAIGLDKENKYLFFIHKKNTDNLTNYLKLLNFNNCETVIINKAEDKNFLDKVQLHFFPKSKSEKEVILNFYDSDRDLFYDGQKELAQKWKNIINKTIN